MDFETRREAERLLRERYNNGREHLEPVRVMQAVRAAAYGYSADEEAPDVPAEDVLAALTQIADARAALDTLELDLIRAARARDASWGRIADSLDLRTRQSAETRALRLERSTQQNAGRDVAAQRLDRARQRSADAWCAAHEERVRAVATAMSEIIAEGWPQLADDLLAVPTLRRLETALADKHPAAQLVEHLDGVRWRLNPYADRKPLEPTGPRAAEAAEARDAMLALLGELAAVRRAVLTVADAEASADR